LVSLRRAFAFNFTHSMDKSKLLAALREETLPRMEAARAALRSAQAAGDVLALAPVRELCHRAAGTGAIAGLPVISRIAAVGETVAQLALEGEAKASPRLCRALAQVLDAIEAELKEEKTERMPSPVAAAPAPAESAGKGRVAVISDEAVSGKLLARVLEDAGFEVTKLKLTEAGNAPTADAVVLDVPSAEGRLAQVDAVLSAALGARLPVLLTGKPDVDALKPIAARASQFLPKPVVPESLVSATRTLVARRRMAAAARSKAPTAQVPSPVTPGAYGAAGRALKVLIVDDSRVIRGVVREALAEVGLVAIEAEDGAEAVRIYDAEKPDAVISDVQMPGLDGAQLTRLLRERDPSRRIPIVVLSALDDEVSRKAGLAAGADAYLVKSVIDGPALLKALERAGLPL
jgi:DNA-binding response OmpR family regulator